MTHTYNPSYSGSRDQEDGGSKPAWANSSQDPILKNPAQKWSGVTQDEGPKFKPQYHKKNFKNLHHKICARAYRMELEKRCISRLCLFTL
jgi:hypothetical protein